MLKKFVRGSAIQCAPSLSSFPGILSGTVDLDGSILQRRLRTSLISKCTLPISSRLLSKTVGMAGEVDSFVNTDVKISFSASALSTADFKTLPE